MNRVERLAQVLVRIVAWVVAVASGVFMLVYLYRWEWNRAMISGLFFVAAELALATIAILRRLRAVEQRLDEVGTAGARSTPLEEPEEARPGPFAWLREPQGESVFVPILLGVGVIISAIAWVVERLAAATWSIGGDAAADRRLRRLSSIGAQGLGDPSDLAVAPSVRFRPLPAGPVRHVGSWTVLLLAAGLLLFGAVNVLAELTQNRPDPPPVGSQTTYTVQIQRRDGSVAEPPLAQALWLTCRELVPEHSGAVTGRAGRYELLVWPSVGGNEDRRFVGCLEDVRLDLILVDVVDSEGVDE